MNDIALTRPETGFLPEPEPHYPPAGDWKDDDGQALDDYFRAADLGPVLYKLVDAIGSFTNAPKTGSRIIRQRFNFPTGGGHAVMAFPADADRIYLSITDVLAKGFYYHSETFTVVDDVVPGPAQTAAAFLTGGGLPTRVELNGYTGPIWVAAAFGQAAALEVVSVTA